MEEEEVLQAQENIENEDDTRYNKIKRSEDPGPYATGRMGQRKVIPSGTEAALVMILLLY